MKIKMHVPEGLTHLIDSMGKEVQIVEGKIEVFAHEVAGYLRRGFKHTEEHLQAEAAKVAAEAKTDVAETKVEVKANEQKAEVEVKNDVHAEVAKVEGEVAQVAGAEATHQEEQAHG